DLTDHAERLVEVVGHRVLVQLAQRTFLRANNSGEVAEVVHRQRDIGIQRLADRFAVVPGLRDGDRLEVLLDPVGDLVEDYRTFGGRRLTPRGSRGVRRIQRP